MFLRIVKCSLLFQCKLYACGPENKMHSKSKILYLFIIIFESLLVSSMAVDRIIIFRFASLEQWASPNEILAEMETLMEINKRKIQK